MELETILDWRFHVRREGILNNISERKKMSNNGDLLNYSLKVIIFIKNFCMSMNRDSTKKRPQQQQQQQER